MQSVYISEPKLRQLTLPYTPGVYAVIFEDGFKVGMSSKLAARINNYLVPWTKPVKSIFYVETLDFVRAEEIFLDKFSRSFSKPKDYSSSIAEYFLLNENKMEEIQTCIKESVIEAELEHEAQQLHTLSVIEPVERDYPRLGLK